MTVVPYRWLSFCDDNPAWGRWDQRWIERILHGTEWAPAGGYQFEPGDTSQGGILIFPCGHYHEHCGVNKARNKLERLVTNMPWSVVIATSDEGSTFPWWSWQRFANHRLWVMTPRPSIAYPPNTFFIGEGCPHYPVEPADKTIDVFFAGQINHERRQTMRHALEQLLMNGTVDIVTGYTEAFLTGMPPDQYMDYMRQARVVPCPSGPTTQDSFRFFEALEAQAVPLADMYRPDGKGAGYWSMLFPLNAGAEVDDWARLPEFLQWALDPATASKMSSWWQQQKRRVAYRLQADVSAASCGKVTTVAERAADEITVFIVTSPSPHHPSTSIIQETLDSVRTRLPGAEILIGMDGIRPEDSHHKSNYDEYERRLCALTNPMQNVCPIRFQDHRHQSGMARFLLELTHTPYVLWMEGDTPLCGDIPFDELLAMMRDHELAVLRFTHEAGILPGHEYLFLDQKPARAPFVRTVQYSARPHLILADKFRDLIATFFGSRTRTFLEDTLYGALQHTGTTSSGRKRAEEAWARHRMAVYAPPGSWKRSEHLDGRGGDPKHPGWIEYDGERPEGGPPPGWMKL